jgi:hypothetical protein
VTRRRAWTRGAYSRRRHATATTRIGNEGRV